MASTRTNRTYAKSSFPTGTYNTDILRKEVKKMGLTSITDVIPTGTDVVLSFTGTLSADDETILDAVVSTHQGQSFSLTTQALGIEASLTSDVDTTVSGEWTNALELTTGPLPEGVYQILTSAEAQVTAGAVVAVRVTLNGGEIMEDDWNQALWHAVSNGIRASALAGDEFTLRIDFRLIGTGTATIRRRRVVLSKAAA